VVAVGGWVVGGGEVVEGKDGGGSGAHEGDTIN
jgi:hypothetical protein